MPDIPVLTELRTRFDEATTTVPAARPLFRTRTAYAIAAAAAIAVAFVAGLAVRPDQSIAGVPLSLVDDRLAVSYQQVLDDPDAVREQLAAAGLDITIETVPATPGLVGHVRWGGGISTDDVIEQSPNLWVIPDCDDDRVCYPWWAPGTDRLRTAPQGFEAGLLIPLDFDDTLTIKVGRATNPDEPYDLEQSPLAQGELLACAPIIGRTVTDASAVLAAYDADIAWALEDPSVQLRQQLDPDGDQRINDPDAAADLIVAGASYLTLDHSTILIIVRRAEPFEWTQAEIEAGNQALLLEDQYYRRGCNL